ncbi:MAG: polysaccharide biosynthesis C-terminal domain-containing protein [Candidatus Diapherotrites archaeon]|nr:polysaccharide biosynthesis C-terminal domain-containing protein [Candidatus Diapherotrites archaeon]
MSEKLYSATARGAIYNYSSTVLVTLLQFLTSIVFIKMLSVFDYGVYNIIIGGVGVLGLVFPVATIMRFLPEYAQKGNTLLAKKLVKTFLFYSLIILGIFALSVFLFSISSFSNGLLKLGITKEFVWFFILISVLTVISGIIDTVLIALIDQKFRSFIRVLYSSLVFLLSLILLSFGFALVGVFAVALASAAVLLSLSAWRLQNLIFSRPLQGGGKLESKRLLDYSLFSSLNYFGDIVLGLTIDIWVIGLFLGAYQAGLYAFAAKTAQTLIALSPAAIATIVVYPMLIKKYTETGSKEHLVYFFGLYSKFIAFFVFPMIIGVVVFADPIIRFVFNPEYVLVTGIFMISAIGFGFSAFRSATLAVYSTLERLDIGFKAKLFFIYNLAADLILVPLYGLTGAIFATTTATFFVFLTEFLLTRKLVNISFPKMAFLRILANSALMGLIVFLILPFVKSTLTLGIAALAGIGSYFALSFINRPFSERDSGFFEKLGFLGKFFSFFSRKNH